MPPQAYAAYDRSSSLLTLFCFRQLLPPPPFGPLSVSTLPMLRPRHLCICRHPDFSVPDGWAELHGYETWPHRVGRVNLPGTTGSTTALPCYAADRRSLPSRQGCQRHSLLL